MNFIDGPSVFHLAQTRLIETQVDMFLNHIGAVKKESDESYSIWNTNAPSDSEKLIEMAGRMCYRSWFPGMNVNVTRVREGNDTYIRNVLDSGHGSVIEHAYDTFAIVGCSRVFTHEVVRHRNANYSQESLRFVRLTELEAMFPNIFANHPQAEKLKTMFRDTFEYLEDRQLQLANLLDLDGLANFSEKKSLTSAMRRMAPIGLATSIIMTSNHRDWRHIIEMRTSRHAEEEIRGVFNQIYLYLSAQYPNIYQDAQEEVVDGLREIKFANRKV
jgi:thymidylate synthase (FAD)